MALKVEFGGPQGCFGVRLGWRAAPSGVAFLFRVFSGFVLGTPLGWFVHADRFGVLALVQLTADLELVRTRGIRLFN